MSSKPRSVAIVMAALAVVAMVALPAVSASAAAGTITLTSGISVNNGPLVAATTVPAGENVRWIVNYNCSNQPCSGAVVTLTLPSGVQTGAASYSTSDVASMSSTPAALTFTMVNPLPAGATGQISVPLTIPAWNTPDNTSFDLDAAAISADAGNSHPPALTINVRADISTSADEQLNSGGALENSSNFSVGGCITLSADPTVGPLGVDAGSTLVATLPQGASYISSSGGTFTPGTGGAPGTVTWVYSSPVSVFTGCSYQRLVLGFDSSDGNAVGQDKTLSSVWTGHKIGLSTDVVLGTATKTITLTPADLGGGFSKSASPNQAATTESVNYLYSASNTGTADWNQVEIDDTVAPQVHATLAHLDTRGANGTAQLFITTLWGPDGIQGTSDDGDEFEVDAAFPAQTANDIGFYSGAFPNSHAALPSGDSVVAFRVIFSDLPAGTGGNLFSLNTTILETDRNGDPVNAGDVFGTTANFTATSGAETTTQGAGADVTVLQQIPTVTTRFGGGGLLPLGVRTSPVSLTASTGGFDWRNPVFVILTPPSVSLDLSTVAASSGSAPLTGRAETTIENWPGAGYGAGWTLYRFAFDPGQAVPAGSGYGIDVTAVLADTAFGNLSVEGYTSSSTDPINLGDNFFGSGADADDKDGDGNVSETLGKWNVGIQLAESFSAALTQSVKGSWDSSFVAGPGTGYSSPGSSDTYRVTVKNTGTVQTDGATVISVLPRPGDSDVLDPAQRNRTVSTFPVVLTGAPVTPSLSSPVVVSYTTVADPCRVELGYSPAGCQNPAWVDWSVTAPSDVGAVTAVKVEFGSNVLNPGLSWSVDLPVTTPTSGASEPDFASTNVDPGSPLTDEVAYSSSAFIIKQLGTSTFLSPAEAPLVGLDMPSVFGPPGAAPSAPAYTSTGAGDLDQSVTVAHAAGDQVTLLDSTNNPVSSLTVPGVGTYAIDSNGVITFDPDAGYTGTPAAVSYRVTDVFDQSTDGTYTPTVALPAAPVVTRLDLSGAATHLTATIAFAAGQTPWLLGAGGSQVTALNIPSEGDYTLDQATGVVTFVPDAGFSGPTTAVDYSVIDEYGQSASSEIDGIVAPPIAQTSPNSDLSKTLAYTGAGTVGLLVVAGALMIVGIVLRRRRSVIASH